MKTRIIALVVDVHNLTLYKDDGETITIAQGDPRVRKLVDTIVPALENSGECLLTEEDMAVYSPYKEAEESLNGLVTFFRVMKAKADEIMARFATEAVTPLVVGQVPNQRNVEQQKQVEEKAPITKSMAAVAEIMEGAMSTSHPNFGATDHPGSEPTTIVAVMPDGTVIGGMEQLSIQMQAVVSKMGSPEGLQNFFKRLASVKRNHAAQDLLKFMEKGELPIADDGTVLVYKRLNRSSESYYVDCHSSSVKQRVGSYVFMDEKMVDARRSVDCSNGLHVARRDYLDSFSGNVCVLAKLAPEDVIAVPHGDARKLRARAYFIIAELSQVDHDNVVRNRPLQDTALLGNAASGNHTPVLETVEITEDRGGGLIVTPVTEANPFTMEDNGRRSESLDNLEPILQEKSSVDARELALKDQAPATIFITPQRQLYDLMKSGDLKAAVELLAFKKAKKKGWPALGLPVTAGDDCYKVIADAEKPQPAVEATPPPPAPEMKAEPVTTSKPTAEMSQSEKAQHLWDLYQKNPDISNARALVTHKQKSKKSWTVLGLTDEIGKRMVNRIS
jgi:hypothetical protein